MSDTPKSSQKWLEKIEKARFKDWERRAEAVVKRYRDDRDGNDSDKKMNILWANTETLKPALYSHSPEPSVVRKFKDKNEVGRIASEVLERALDYSVEQYDFDSVVNDCVEDWLLPGRAVAKVTYKPYYGTEVLNADEEWGDEDNEGNRVKNENFEPLYEVSYEEVLCDYYDYRDFRHGKARRWKEVPWVAFRNWMTRPEFEKRFGKEYTQYLDFTKMAEKGNDSDTSKETPAHTVAVWEVWDKVSRKVIWVAEDCKAILDESDPTIDLENFFPCPEPLFAVSTNGTMKPIPEFCMYQDQADEIDVLTERIHLLSKALKVSGVYDGAHTEIERLVSEDSENQLIGVDSWAALAEKGGMKGVIDWMPIEQIAAVLVRLYEVRERTKAELYEITGISDIIRGASGGPVKTATEQRIKGQYAGLRLRDRQRALQRFIRDLIRIKAEVICEKFSAATLSVMTNIPEDQIEQVLPVLQNDAARSFNITIGTDSTIEPDEQADKESRVEFLNASSSFMERMLPMAVQAPEMAPLIAKMLMFGMRGFKQGRELEGDFEQTFEKLAAQAQQPKPQQPNPAILKLQQDGMLKRGEQQLKAGDLQLKARELALKEKQAGVDTLEKVRQDQRAQEDHELTMAERISALTPEQEQIVAKLPELSVQELALILQEGGEFAPFALDELIGRGYIQ